MAVLCRMPTIQCSARSARLLCVPSEKSTGMVADTVANITAELLMTHNAAIRAVARAGEGKIDHSIK